MRMNEMIKQIAVNAVEAQKPCAVLFGVVESASPLKINVEQKLTLGEKFFILTKNVQKYEVDIEVSHHTVEDALMNGSHTHTTDDGSTDSGTLDTTHKHAYKGRKKIVIHNELVTGDKVILLRLTGGQKYIVLDKINNHTVTGEWI